MSDVTIVLTSLEQDLLLKEADASVTVLDAMSALRLVTDAERDLYRMKKTLWLGLKEKVANAERR